MYNNLNVYLDVCDDNTIDLFIKKTQNINLNKFVWAVNPSKSFFQKTKKNNILVFCNNVLLSKKKETINNIGVSEYDMYIRNIKFKAINRLLFLNYSHIFLEADNNQDIKNDYDVIFKNKNIFYIKNNNLTKDFFYNFEYYLMYEKQLVDGKNLFSFHNFYVDLLASNIKKKLKVYEE